MTDEKCETCGQEMGTTEECDECYGHAYAKQLFGCKNCDNVCHQTTVIAEDYGPDGLEVYRQGEILLCAKCGTSDIEVGVSPFARWTSVIPEQLFDDYWQARDAMDSRDIHRLAMDAKEGNAEAQKLLDFYDQTEARRHYAQCDCGSPHAVGVARTTEGLEAKKKHFDYIYHHYHLPLPIGFTKLALCCGKVTEGTATMEDVDKALRGE